MDKNNQVAVECNNMLSALRVTDKENNDLHVKVELKK